MESIRVRVSSIVCWKAMGFLQMCMTVYESLKSSAHLQITIKTLKRLVVFIFPAYYVCTSDLRLRRYSIVVACAKAFASVCTTQNQSDSCDIDYY